ncbi:MAG: response regulator [Desulfarculaceae bacterium]|jgi:DNA-binding NtrC family response regulator
MGSPKVLVVDDEIDFLDALVARLRIRGFEALGVADGQAALASLEDDLPEVVVLDLKMPGMDGMEVLRRIKSSYPQVEVVILTGHGSAEAGMEGLSLGAFAYLVKPVKLPQLIEKVEDALKWRRTANRRPDASG